MGPIKPLRTAKGRSYDAFVVQIPREQNVEEVTAITGILNLRVRWEPFKSSGIIQCKRCQRFGHIAANCAIGYRCVKCKGSHLPGQCAKKDEESPACVNCGEERHPANFRGCKFYLRRTAERRRKMEMAKEEREERRSFVNRAVNNYTTKGVSFASMFDRKTSVTSSTAATSFMNLSHDLFGVSLSELLGKINDFLSHFNTLRSKAEQQAAYLQFFVGVCNG